MDEENQKNFEELKEALANKDTLIVLNTSTQRVITLNLDDSVSYLNNLVSAISSDIYRFSKGQVDPEDVYSDLKDIVMKYIDEVEK